MPGGQTYREELLGQLLIITMLQCISAHSGTSALEASVTGRVGCLFCACLHTHLMSVCK